MPEGPLRHTKSEALKWLVRRRNRQRKPRANSGEKVYSWAEYSEVNFTPTGEGSVRWLGIVAGVLLAVPLVIYVGAILFQTGVLIVSEETGWLEKLIVIPLFLVVMTAPIWGTALIAWIYARLDGNTKASRARLIAAADRLREARDAEANRGT